MKDTLPKKRGGKACQRAKKKAVACVPLFFSSLEDEKRRRWSLNTANRGGGKRSERGRMAKKTVKTEGGKN